MLSVWPRLPILRPTRVRPGAALQRCLHPPPLHPALSKRSLRSLHVSRTPSPFLQRRPGLVRLVRNARHTSGKAIPQESGSQAPQSISGRFKDLSRRYGWAAVGVYMGLSVLDFPFCFLAVRLIGPERIGEAEHAVVDTFWNVVGTVVPSMQAEDRTAKEAVAEAEARESPLAHENGHKDNASIWTQLLLAYGVHKSLIFFRVPLTAAVTPKVVKTLRSWGWNIGRPAKAAKPTS